MLNGITSLSITKDLTKEFKKSLEELAKKNVCIGVPDNTQHSDDKVTNAQLMYIHTNGARNMSMRQSMQHDLEDGVPYSRAHELYVHENGSPLWDIPPRPILQPAMENSKEQMAELMKESLLDALDGKEIDVALNEVGLQGQNISRDWFDNPANNWAKNSEDTIKRKGSDKPLIDKGDLRKSITYVIKEGDF